MKKIGIITIHNVINYGAALQAYALLRTVRDQFIECKVEIIDYMPSYFEKVKGIFKLVNVKDLRTFLIELERLILSKKHKKVELDFRNFIEGNNNLSPFVNTLDEIGKQYDVIISGSDQIWNQEVTGGTLDHNFYLSFSQDEKVKKIAYASSLGDGYQVATFEKEKAVKWWKKYEYLSCREKDGCDYVEKESGKKCELVLNPSLLLNRENWEEHCEKGQISIKEADKYLLIYRLANSEVVYDTAKIIAEKYGLKVYEIGTTLRKNKAVDKLIGGVSPQEFLWLFSNAEYVVTNSFHGTAFSVNFNKNFYSVLPEKRTSRITSLLKNLGLEERIVRSALHNISAVNYEFVNRKLEQSRKESKKYLFEAIEMCTGEKL